MHMRLSLDRTSKSKLEVGHAGGLRLAPIGRKTKGRAGGVESWESFWEGAGELHTSRRMRYSLPGAAKTEQRDQPSPPPTPPHSLPPDRRAGERPRACLCGIRRAGRHSSTTAPVCRPELPARGGRLLRDLLLLFYRHPDRVPPPPRLAARAHRGSQRHHLVLVAEPRRRHICSHRPPP